MSSKIDIPEDGSGEQPTDSPLDNRTSPADDQSQITMNFGDKTDANDRLEQEFKEWAEAEMKNRAQEGKRMKEALEARKQKEAQIAKAKTEAKRKLDEEDKLRKGVEAVKKHKEKVEAQNKAKTIHREEIQAQKEAKKENSLGVQATTDEIRTEDIEVLPKLEQNKTRHEEVEAHLTSEKLSGAKKVYHRKNSIKVGSEVEKTPEEERLEQQALESIIKAEEAQKERDNAEDQRIIKKEQLRKEKMEEPLEIQERSRLNEEEEARKLRDEEWQKFKDSAIAKRESDIVHHRTSTSETECTDTVYDEFNSAEAKNDFESETNCDDKKKKKKLLLILLAALTVIAMTWLLPLTEDEPIRIKSSVPDLENSSITPESQPESETVTGEGPIIETQEAAPSNLALGDAFGGGLVFEIDASGKKGKIAYSKDAGPMPYKDAAKYSKQLGEGWRLPTMRELGTIYNTLGQGAKNSGSFSDDLYWSATPYETYQARLFRFSDGNTSYHYNNGLSSRKFKVRAVRDFGR